MKKLKTYEPDFISINAAKCVNPDWKKQGLNSENFVAFNLTEKIQLIGGYLVRRRNEKRYILLHELPATITRYCSNALLS